MSGFTKLFSSITESSIWTSDDKTLRVWIAMLARADSGGVVEGSIPGFASLCRMTVEDFTKAIGELSGPDPYSRTPDREGRRIEQIQGGWRILNYLAYRERGQAKDGSRAPYFREYRARLKTSGPVARNKRNTGPVARNTEAEAEAEAENTLPKTARKVNPKWEALAALEGWTPTNGLTKPASGRVGEALKQIKAVHPDVTAAEILARVEAYRRLYPRASVTSTAISAHWAKLTPSTAQPEQPAEGFLQ